MTEVLPTPKIFRRLPSVSRKRSELPEPPPEELERPRKKFTVINEHEIKKAIEACKEASLTKDVADGKSIVEEFAEVDENNKIMPLLPLNKLGIKPLTSSVDVDKYELFLMVLTYKFKEANPEDALPEIHSLFEMQSRLINMNNYLSHQCIRGDFVCNFARHKKGDVYYSLILEQYMVATGLVCVCVESGSYHVCDSNCSGDSNEDGRTCSWTGLYKRERLKSTSTYSSEGKTENEGTTSNTANFNPISMGSGYGHNTGGGKGSYFACSPSVNFQYISNSMRDKDDTNAHTKPKFCSMHEHKTLKGVDHMHVLNMVPTEILLRRKKREKLEKAYQNLKNIQHNANKPTNEQQEHILDDSNIGVIDYELDRARKSTQKALDSIFLPMNPTESMMLEYKQFKEIERKGHLMRNQALNLFKEIFTFTAAKKSKEMTVADVNNRASKAMGSYIRICQKYDVAPNFFYAFVIYSSTAMTLARTSAPNDPEYQLLVLAELSCYYWERLRPLFFKEQKALQSTWLSEFRKFTVGLMYIMQRGLKIKKDDGQVITVLAGNQFVNYYLRDSSTLRNTKELSKHWVFKARTTIIQIILLNKNNPNLFEMLDMTKAFTYANEKAQAHFNVKQPKLVNAPSSMNKEKKAMKDLRS